MGETKYGFQIKRAVISTTSSGDNTLVAAVSGMKITVVFLYLVSSDRNTITFESSTTTALSGAQELTDQSVVQLPMNEYGWMSTASGELLNLNLTKANQISGFLGYFLE